MQVPIANSTATKCAVQLNGAHHKTIHVKWNASPGVSHSPIAVLQMDNDHNIATSRILSADEPHAEFSFFDDGELWLVVLAESAGTPMSADSAATFDFALSGIALHLEIEGEEQGGSRDTMTDAKAKVPDEV